MPIGVLLEISGNSGTDQWSVTYTGPGSPLGTTWTGSGWSSVTSSVLITDLKVYNSGSTLDIEFSYEVFAGGVSRITGSVSTAGAGSGPSYPAIIGIPFGLAGSASASTTGLPTYADDDVYSYDSTANGSASGGWRYKEPGSGTWVNLPVTLAPGGAPSIPGGCDDPGVGEVGADNTAELSVTSYSRNKAARILFDSGSITHCNLEMYCDGVLVYSETVEQFPPIPWEQFRTTTESWSRSGNVRGFPNLEKAIIRFNPDFKALWWRSEMPQTKRLGVASCDIDGVVSTTTQDVEVHPNQAEILQAVTGLTAAMEDTFGYASYAPWGQSGSYDKAVSYFVDDIIAACPSAPVEIENACRAGGGTITTVDTFTGGPTFMPSESQSASRSYTFPSSVGASSDMVGYQGHANALARYWNSWCNPHWSYGLVTDDWDVDSNPETWNDYWKKVGSQWLNNAGASIAINTRNHLWSEALENDGNGSFLDSFFGGYRWIGQVRWQTKAVTPLASYQFDSDSSSLWAGTNCTLTHGSTITINPSALTCEVALTLGSFTAGPRLWVHLADRITADWTLANIDAVKVYLEGQDGTRVLLNDNEPGVAKYRPSGQTTEYAGTWAQDFGANGVTDVGIDHAVTTGGISGANMVDPHTATAFQMLADRTATKLVFVITVDDVDVDCELEYPLFEYTKSANRKIVWENAHQAAIIHPSGPGVRFAGFNTGTSGTINNPPALYDGFERPNVVDWLVFERLLVRGVAHNDGLTTELTNLYDSYEGNSVGQVRGSSHGFLLPVTNSTWNIALVNSLSEVPPLAGFPRRRRSSSTWLETGVDFVQHSYAGMQSPDYFVNPSQGVELRTDDDTTVWTNAGTGVTGWAVTQHEQPVDNTETDFGVWLGDRFAELRPFRGHYSVVPPLAGSVGVAIAVRSDWYIAYGRINDSGTVSLRFAYAGQAPGDEIDTGQSAVNLSMAWDKGQPGRLVMAIETAGGNINVVASQDEGEIWTLATTVATGPGNTFPAITITPDGVRHVYWISGGDTIKGRLYNSAMTAFGAEFTVKSGVDDSGLAVDNARASGGVATIEMAHIEGGAVVVSRSTDGETFV